MDTKNFSFKTGVRTFEAAAYLRKYGIDIIRVKKWFQSDLESYNVIADNTGYTQHNISLDGSVQNVTISHTVAYNDQIITLSSTNGYPIESFKLNGTLVEGNTFIMPESNVYINIVYKENVANPNTIDSIYIIIIVLFISFCFFTTFWTC